MSEQERQAFYDWIHAYRMETGDDPYSIETWQAALEWYKKENTK